MRKYCLNCKTATDHRKVGIGAWHIFHLIFTVFVWPWIAVWALHSIFNDKAQCTACGCES